MAIITAAEKLRRDAEERLKPLAADGTVKGFSVVEIAGRATLEVRISLQTNPTAASFDRAEYDRVQKRLREALGGLHWRIAAKADAGRRRE